MSRLLYFLIVTPAGLLYRLIARDPLHLVPRAGAGSYWSAPRRRRFTGEDFRQR